MLFYAFFRHLVKKNLTKGIENMELTGDQVLKIRRIYRLSQKDVADLTGVSEAFICMIEKESENYSKSLREIN